jgi:hypothetical protein
MAVLIIAFLRGSIDREIPSIIWDPLMLLFGHPRFAEFAVIPAGSQRWRGATDFNEARDFPRSIDRGAIEVESHSAASRLISTQCWRGTELGYKFLICIYLRSSAANPLPAFSVDSRIAMTSCPDYRTVFWSHAIISGFQCCISGARQPDMPCPPPSMVMRSQVAPTLCMAPHMAGD